MTLYGVWSGEYSDKCMNAIFQSKEKAEKYVELQEKLDAFHDCYYIQEYELADDKVNMTDRVEKYYYATIECQDSDRCKKGYISTDECWDAFIDSLSEEIKLDYDSLKPSNYVGIIKYWGRDVDDYEESYGVTVENKVYKNNNSIIVPFARPILNEKKRVLDEITVYSTESYSKARKIAIEQYQIYTQQMLETDGQLESFHGANLVYNEDDPWDFKRKDENAIWQ